MAATVDDEMEAQQAQQAVRVTLTLNDELSGRLDLLTANISSAQAALEAAQVALTQNLALLEECLQAAVKVI